jgi:hypothetical protein
MSSVSLLLLSCSVEISARAMYNARSSDEHLAV